MACCDLLIKSITTSQFKGSKQVGFKVTAFASMRRTILGGHFMTFFPTVINLSVFLTKSDDEVNENNNDTLHDVN